MTKEDLWKLRKEVILCSMFYKDYENSFNYDRKGVCDFFDGYAESLKDLMSEDGEDTDKFFELLSKYDNIENLWEYYCSLDEVYRSMEESFFKVVEEEK